MADPVVFTGLADEVGAGLDWEASAEIPVVVDPFVPEFETYDNWLPAPILSPSPAPPPLPFGADLVVPIDSSLGAGETFPAASVDLTGGNFTDSGTIIATSLTVGTSATMSMLPTSVLQLNGNLTLAAAATLDVEGEVTAPTGNFVGNGDSGSELTIGGSMSIGMGIGGSFTLTSPVQLSFFDRGMLEVGGNFTLQATTGNLSFVAATVEMDQYPLISGVNVIDNAHGTVLMEASSLVVGTADENRTPTLQLGASGDGTVIDMVESSITGTALIDNLGTVDVNGAGRIGVAGDYLNDGSGAVTEVANGFLSFQSGGQFTTIDPASAGSFEIGTAGTLDLGDNTQIGRATVDFTGTSGVLAVESGIGAFNGAISGFSGTDELEIEGSNITSARFDGAHTVQVTETDGTVLDFTDLPLGLPAGPLAFVNSGANGFVEDASGGPCFCPGTHIRTADGAVPVETLGIGDRVVTRSGALRPIKWVGRRHYGRSAAAGNRNVWPVKIGAGALGAGLPSRDLWVSPEHAMLLDEMLIPARALVNSRSIVQVDPGAEVSYVHLEFETHEVIYAEDALTESYVDDDSRAYFDNAEEYWARYPGERPEPERFCLPRIEEGFELEGVRRRLAATDG